MQKIKDRLFLIIMGIILIGVIIICIIFKPNTKQSVNNAHSIADLLNETGFYEHPEQFSQYNMSKEK